MLQRTGAVVKHFEDFQEDQFDFHAYCVRKVTLRAYTEVLSFEDNIWSENYYYRAASGITRIYLNLFDDPSIMEGDKEPDYSKMTAAERKKAKAIARKKRNQAEKKASEKAKSESQENGGAAKAKGKTSPVDEDPEGKELLKLDPLLEAKKYSSILSTHCPTRLGTWTLQYDVAVRRKKWLLALQALCKMNSLDPLNAEYFCRLVDFALKVPTLDGLSEPAKLVLSEEFPKLLSGKTVETYVSEAAQSARSNKTTSLPLRVAVAESLIATKLESAGSAASIITDGGIAIPGVSVDSCRVALVSLKKLGPDASKTTDAWVSMVKETFPMIKNFQ